MSRVKVGDRLRFDSAFFAARGDFEVTGIHESYGCPVARLQKVGASGRLLKPKTTKDPRAKGRTVYFYSVEDIHLGLDCAERGMNQRVERIGSAT